MYIFIRTIEAEQQKATTVFAEGTSTNSIQKVIPVKCPFEDSLFKMSSDPCPQQYHFVYHLRLTDHSSSKNT